MKRIPALIAFVAMAAAPLAAVGLATAFADVHVTEVPLGRAYNLAKQMGKPLDLKNLGDTPLTVQVEVLKPAPTDLKGGAEAIPDVRWVVVRPNRVELAPHQNTSCEVIITVPKDPAYRGKLYQVMIWSKSLSGQTGQGMRVNAGLLSRLRFKTAP